MTRFSWLHLTDLHFGQSGQGPLWPNVKQAFFDDLAKLHERTGPWQVVLFSGDFVQRGMKAEFEQLEEFVIAPLWERMKELGSEPYLLAVPGNHDLIRPEVTKPVPAAVRQLLRKDGFAEIADEFFDDPIGEYREIINAAFAEYAAWWRTTPFRHPDVCEGILPGEFSVSLEVDNHRVGIVGLNTTFLQLEGGDYTSRLAWDVRQFNAAATGGNPQGDAPGWVGQHDVCLLMTHQGPEWLDANSRDSVYPEINPAGRFAVHVFGHMHENVVRGSSVGGGKMRWQWQGNSLFGLEKFGDPPTIDRRHGYSAGTIDFNGHSAGMRHWPRNAIKDDNGWRFERDTKNCVLDENDGGTESADLSINPRPRRRKKTAAAKRSIPSLTIPERKAMAAYVNAAQNLWDIVDLAGLPEDERHIAMQHFLLRQLFVPLRLTVEAPAAEDLSEEAIDELERQR